MFTPEAMAGYLGTAIFTLINLAVIYWFLQRFLFKPFNNIIEKRKKLIEDQLEEAQAKREEAEKQELEIQERIKASVKKAANIVEQARMKAETQEAQIIRASEEEAENMLERTREEVKRIRSTMYVDMRTEIADLAVSIASRVIGSAMGKDEQYKMVNELIDEEIAKQTKDSEGDA